MPSSISSVAAISGTVQAIRKASLAWLGAEEPGDGLVPHQPEQRRRSAPR